MFLHQTTTVMLLLLMLLRCILSCSYIKPQPDYVDTNGSPSCILSCSYIKPQLLVCYVLVAYVVYYHVPTSNHNIS